MAKILVVDDIDDNRKLLEFDLEDDGHKVLQADGGPKALEVIKGDKPDLVLLDVNMPGMSGIDVLKAMQADEEMNEVPVIMVTANDLDDEVIEAMSHVRCNIDVLETQARLI